MQTQEADLCMDGLRPQFLVDMFSLFSGCVASGHYVLQSSGRYFWFTLVLEGFLLGSNRDVALTSDPLDLGEGFFFNDQNCQMPRK